MDFKDKLKKLRNENGLSQEALAEAVHISRSAIAKYENGNGNPSEETLKALAVYFGVEVDELRSDNSIKKNKKNKFLIKVGIIASIVLLIGGTAAGITLGIIGLNKSGNNPGSEQQTSESGGETIITGVDAYVAISNSTEIVSTYKDPDTKEIYYYTNTFLDFDIGIYPLHDGSKGVAFTGDHAIFNHDYSFSNSYYVGNQYGEESRYRIEFKKEGTYTLNYSFNSYINHLNFIIDNSNSTWNNYKSTLKNVCPWINEVTKSNIQNLRYEYSNSSLGPDYFRNIYYSSGETDIDAAYHFLENNIYKTNKDLHVDGEGTSILEYSFNNITSKSISITGKSLNTAVSGTRYLIEKIFAEPLQYTEHRYMVNQYGNNIEAVKKSTLSRYPISYLYNLEFVEWPNEEAYDETLEAPYEITGYIADIEVFTSNRFSYNSKMYKVVSAQDFSNLFDS